MHVVGRRCACFIICTGGAFSISLRVLNIPIRLLYFVVTVQDTRKNDKATPRYASPQVGRKGESGRLAPRRWSALDQARAKSSGCVAAASFACGAYLTCPRGCEEDWFWERSVERSSHMYRRKIYQKELSIGESYRRTAGLGLLTRA